MKTDLHIYTFLATGIEAFRVITGGIVLPDYYRFSAPVLKGVERRIDALFDPQGHAGPAYVVEFQAQTKPEAWYNLLVKVALYGEQHPQQSVRGILIFPQRVLDTQQASATPQIAPDLLSVVYLDEILPNLLVQEPNNPYVAVFAPLVLDNQETLKQQAPHLWRTVHAAPETVRTNLEHILESWFFERFKTLNHKEVLAMFQNLCPLEETLAYQGIFAEGEARGIAKGEARGIAKGKAEGKVEGAVIILKRQILHRFGKLPKWAQTRIDQANTVQLEAWAEAIFDAKDLKQLLSDPK